MEKVKQLPEEIKNLVCDSKFAELYSLGLIDEIGLRNFIIKTEYKNLRKSQSMGDSIYILSKKHFLSEDAIISIIFRKRKTKSINILPHFN